jgi:hypothetical protein
MTMTKELDYGLRVAQTIPNRVELPEWLNRDALARPGAIDAAHTEAIDLERRIVALIPELSDIITRTIVLEDVVGSIGGWAWDPDDGKPTMPDAMRDALDEAGGARAVARLVDLFDGYRLTGKLGHPGTTRRRREAFREHGPVQPGRRRKVLRPRPRAGRLTLAK